MSHIIWVCISHFIFLHPFSWIVFQFSIKPFLSMLFSFQVIYLFSDRDFCLFLVFMESTKNWKYSWDLSPWQAFILFRGVGHCPVSKRSLIPLTKNKSSSKSGIYTIFFFFFCSFVFKNNLKKVFRFFFPQGIIIPMIMLFSSSNVKEENSLQTHLFSQKRWLMMSYRHAECLLLDFKKKQNK